MQLSSPIISISLPLRINLVFGFDSELFLLIYAIILDNNKGRNGLVSTKSTPASLINFMSSYRALPVKPKIN